MQSHIANITICELLLTRNKTMFKKLITTTALAIALSTNACAATSDKKFSIDLTALSNKPTATFVYNMTNIFGVEAGVSTTYSDKLDSKINKKSSTQNTFENDYKSSASIGIRATSPEKIGPVTPYASLGAGYYFNAKNNTLSHTKKQKLHGIGKVGLKADVNDNTQVHVTYSRFLPNKDITVAKNAIGMGVSFNF